MSREQELQKMVRDAIVDAIDRDLCGDELLMKEVFEDCRTEAETKIVRDAMRLVIATLQAQDPIAQTNKPRVDLKDLEAEVRHWQKIAMLEAGFAPNIADAVLSGLSCQAEMSSARKTLEGMLAKRKL